MLFTILIKKFIQLQGNKDFSLLFKIKKSDDKFIKIKQN